MLRVQTGLENFIASPPKWAFDTRIGLLCNPASVNSNFSHASVLIDQRFPGQLRALYSPQHGYFSEKQTAGNSLKPEIQAPQRAKSFYLYVMIEKIRATCSANASKSE